MSLTDRDRKILMALIPLAIVAAYWFLVLQPKRQESAAVQDQLTQAESARDTAVQKAANLSGAKRSFQTDYAAVIYLGKSIPSTVDTPSLLVQLDRAARGTGIDFESIQTGDRSGSDTSSATNTTTSTPAGGNGSPASSSTPAKSGTGQTAQTAGNAVNTANSASAKESGSSASGSSTPTAASGSSVAGLDSVPLDFQFRGSFFDLADFFHRMKRFVRVANNQIIVRGRLMTINSFSFDSQDAFPKLKVTMHATVYLAPKAQGVSAGATPNGPAGAPPAAASGQTASTSSPTPAATVTAP